MDKRDEIKKLTYNICWSNIYIYNADYLSNNSIINFINFQNLQ